MSSSIQRSRCSVSGVRCSISFFSISTLSVHVGFISQIAPWYLWSCCGCPGLRGHRQLWRISLGILDGNPKIKCAPAYSLLFLVCFRILDPLSSLLLWYIRWGNSSCYISVNKLNKIGVCFSITYYPMWIFLTRAWNSTGSLSDADSIAGPWHPLNTESILLDLIHPAREKKRDSL